MAKYPAEQFAHAAREYARVHGLTDADDTDGTKDRVRTLANKLGEKNPATAELLRVAKLRPSIARRFIRISVQSLVGPKTKAPKGTAKAKAAAKAPARKSAARKRAPKQAASTNGAAEPTPEPASA